MRLTKYLRSFALAVSVAAATLAGAQQQNSDPAALLAPNSSFPPPTIDNGPVSNRGATASGARASLAPSSANPPAVITPVKPSGFDYSVNLLSDVFGASMFSGAFAREGGSQFNPDYLIAVGDKLQVRMWGGYELDTMLVVDPKGNIFLPHVGPVYVLGARNQDLQANVDKAIRKIFKANVYSYASLAAAQPVRIFVSGFVYRPGLYAGTSMDSLLHYLDQAGGIDIERGSFLDIQVRRGAAVRAQINLYDFLLEGRIPVIQLTDGDVVFVAPRKSVVRVTGLTENAKRFEFKGPQLMLADLTRMARPFPATTHVRVTRNSGTLRSTEYYDLQQSANLVIGNGDEVEFTADKKTGTISVRVEGEHQSAQEYVLPYGSKLGDLISQIRFNERSDKASLQLFRQSVKERQKQMLLISLKSLESAALTARSGSGDEATLRRAEAELLLQWVDRARNVETTGQVFIAESKQRDEILLENGDVLRVPTRDGLVLVSGEILFPNTIAYDPRLDADAYIRRAGGYTQNADVSRVIVAHRDGSFADVANGKVEMRPGDQILVLPKIDTKARQYFKDLTQIIYQMAIAAKVVIGL